MGTRQTLFAWGWGGTKSYSTALAPARLPFPGVRRLTRRGAASTLFQSSDDWSRALSLYTYPSLARDTSFRFSSPEGLIRLKFSRRGIGEVAGSLSMLVVTMALLTSASFLSFVSVKAGASLLPAGAQGEAIAAGQLVGVVATQSNITGSYVWLFNYGWEDAPITRSYGRTAAPLSSCGFVSEGSMCVLSLPPGTRGELTLLVGANT